MCRSFLLYLGISHNDNPCYPWIRHRISDQRRPFLLVVNLCTVVECIRHTHHITAALVSNPTAPRKDTRVSPCCRLRGISYDSPHLNDFPWIADIGRLPIVVYSLIAHTSFEDKRKTAAKPRVMRIFMSMGRAKAQSIISVLDHSKGT